MFPEYTSPDPNVQVNLWLMLSQAGHTLYRRERSRISRDREHVVFGKDFSTTCFICADAELVLAPTLKS